jgi:hypothetical protein
MGIYDVHWKLILMDRFNYDYGIHCSGLLVKKKKYPF